MESCEICQKTQNLDRHHIVSRRTGGSKDPAVNADENQLTLCRHCHRNIHDGNWQMERSPESIRIFDRRTGAQIMRRLHAPDFDASNFFQLLNVMDGSLADALTLVPYLDTVFE